jgi:glycolate oxidase FAD binding subunit
VEWAPLSVREACPVWDPPGPSVALMRGIKARLDPQGVLNPGRFVGGI